MSQVLVSRSRRACSRFSISSLLYCTSFFHHLPLLPLPPMMPLVVMACAMLLNPPFLTYTLCKIKNKNTKTRGGFSFFSTYGVVFCCLCVCVCPYHKEIACLVIIHVLLVAIRQGGHLIEEALKSHSTIDVLLDLAWLELPCGLFVLQCL